jgi:hypothetical protein
MGQGNMMRCQVFAEGHPICFEMFKSQDPMTSHGAFSIQQIIDLAGGEDMENELFGSCQLEQIVFPAGRAESDRPSAKFRM